MMRILAITIALLTIGTAAAAQSVRVKDISNIEGVRTNQLIGYGLIVGLEGSGDSQQTKFTTQSLANMLSNYGITVPGDKIKIKNAAAVIVTATLPPFARPGATIDVVVSSMGDARSLQGGTLLQTPLRAANGEVYAVAQGPVSIGGFGAGGGGSTVTKNHPTVGRVPNGALVEKETKTDIAPGDTLNITLSRNDFTTASRVSDAINLKLMQHVAKPIDGNVISVNVPSEYKGDIVSLVTTIESIEVTSDTPAKIIVNERTGTVVIGGNARITPVAITHGALTVEIATETNVSQPETHTDGTTAVTSTATTTAKEQEAYLMEIKGGTTIDELVRALNELKVTPRDLIAILQAVQEAGALQAQLEIM